MLKSRAVAPMALLFAIVASSCGGGGATDTRSIEPINSRELLPVTVLDLNVAPEAVEEAIKDPDPTYAERVGLYSFRKGELLQATLQITKLSEEAKVGKEDFRLGIVRGIATGEISELRMGERTIWLSQSLRQNVAIWFDDRTMFVLSAREEFDRPRALLRELVQMEVKP